MTWGTPPTPAAGTVLTAAHIQTIADDLNFLKSGVATLTTQSASVGPTTTTTELTLVTSGSVTFDGTTLAEVSFSWYNMSQTVSTDVFFVRLYDGSTQVAQWFSDISANGGGGNMRAVLTPTAGAHTFTARLVRSSGTGTGSMVAGAASPAQLLVRQVN